MARLNEILVGRFNRSYQKLFGLKGPPPVATLAPEIMPSHVLFSGAEERYPQGWNRFAFPAVAGAVAAQTTAIRFRNPTGSNTLAVIEKMCVTEALADNVILGNQLGNTDLTVGGAGTRVDIRGNPNAVMVISTGNNASSGTGMYQIGVQANIGFDLVFTDIQELPLLPGDQIQLTTVAVNVVLRVSFLWRERFLEEGERT